MDKLSLSGADELWELLQGAARAPHDRIVIGIYEVPPGQAMEMGQIMPEVEGS